MTHLDITEVVLVYCNISNNDYQHRSKASHTFAPNISFGQQLNILLKSVILLKTINWDFSYIEVWFTEQNSKPLTLVIN